MAMILMRTLWNGSSTKMSCEHGCIKLCISNDEHSGMWAFHDHELCVSRICSIPFLKLTLNFRCMKLRVV